MGGGKEVYIEVENTLGAAVGDHVVVSLSDSSFLTATFLAYLVPVLALLAGALAGDAMAPRLGLPPDGGAALFGLGLFALAVLGVRRLGNRLGADPRYRPRLSRIVPKGRQGCSVKSGS